MPENVNKLEMKSVNIVDENIEKIENLFPNVIVESENGKAIDFDLLKQELSKDVIEGNKEKYQLTWPGKRDAIVIANTPINKTLRPIKEKSVDFDNTKNIYIEGDNLEALKILQESYLNKVKCIYIDPPYNTGNDFIYNDKFSKNSKDELKDSGQVDEYNNRLISNSEANGKFHSDWLNMIYVRLKLARNLLSSDGVIFISIDDNEVDNLKKICNEIFGENNFQSCISWRRRSNQPNDLTKMIAKVTEYILVYSKNAQYLRETKNFGTIELSEERLSSYTNPDNDPNGPWTTTPWCASKGQGGTKYKIVTPKGIEYDEVWLGTKETFEEHLKNGRIIFTNNGEGKPRKKIYVSEAIKKGQSAIDFWVGDRYGDNQVATNDLKKIFGTDRIFDYSKPVKLIENIIKIGCPNDEDIFLDFFSGSASSAHACLNMNAKEKINRKFIMVQIPEYVDEKIDAYKEGYKTICEIGEERIRRVAKKIKKETNANIDYGFRVYKVDTSNMKDVYYEPSKLEQTQLNMLETNIKEDRTSEDLLTQVILDLGLTLDLKIEEKTILNNKVYFVAENSLVACFDDKINMEMIDEICKEKPLKVVFRESSFKSDNDKINTYERIKKLSTQTQISII